MAKKSGSGGIALTIIAIIVAALAAIPKEALIGCVVVVVIIFVYRAAKAKSDSGRPSADEVRRRESLGYGRGQPEHVGLRVDAVSYSERTGYRIPRPALQTRDAKWIPAGEPITVARTVLPGGMLYVGSSLPSPNGVGMDPGLINPSLSVANDGDYRERQTNYWPSYSNISPTARRAYLNWLASGRRVPDADIGYVFLFFYGLEHRVFIDLAHLSPPSAELNTILREVEDLIKVYGGTSNSFTRYGNALANAIRLICAEGKLYGSPLPPLKNDGDVPLYLRVALGQAVQDGVAISSQLALAWLRNSATVNLRAPATRCAAQFDELFSTLYRAELGEGIKIQPNRTKLRFSYQAASGGFSRPHLVASRFSELPDVTVLSGPLKRMLPLAEEAAKQLESYSRFVGRNAESANALEGLLLLPATLWPPTAQQKVEQLRQRMGAGMVSMDFGELLALLDASGKLSRDKTIGLARALHSINIGFEPDVLSGARTPKPEEPIILFSIEPEQPGATQSAEFHAAQLTIELAAAVATADGDFEAAELVHLGKQVQSWSHLTPNHQRRLLAHLRLLSKAPVTLNSLKSKLSGLQPAARSTIATFMAAVAQADGVVSAQEIKMLEKVYKALGVDAQQVFRDVHAIASGGEKVSTKPQTDVSAGFKLDKSKIALLQQESEKVSAILSEIFREDEVPQATAVEEPAEEVDVPVRSLLGLDETHSNLARALLARPEWTRTELIDLSDDIGIMLDGALEQLNDAAYEQFDAPFGEGEDPFTINPDLLEKFKDDAPIHTP